ncbi:MAG: hypothetical protein KY392_03030 [Chloroflexi bacterium]|nr:hypothetical protein [Chloroflexota bacterium]
MTLVPNPVLYDAVARERIARFRAPMTTSRRRPTRQVRVRIGRLLISAGTVISGDCIELRPRRATRQSHAA